MLGAPVFSKEQIAWLKGIGVDILAYISAHDVQFYFETVEAKHLARRENE